MSDTVALTIMIAVAIAIIIGAPLLSHHILQRAQDKRSAELDREMAEREDRLDREYGIDTTTGERP